jgi:hypothetical protein
MILSSTCDTKIWSNEPIPKILCKLNYNTIQYNTQKKIIIKKKGRVL